MKLAAYLKAPDRSLNAAEIGQDNKCELGRWIEANRAAHSALPEFATLKKEHTRFHRAAGDVVRRADAGERVTEEVALGAKSEYASASGAVVSALMAISKKVQLVS
jgi:hypothetical protein